MVAQSHPARFLELGTQPQQDSSPTWAAPAPLKGRGRREGRPEAAEQSGVGRGKKEEKCEGKGRNVTGSRKNRPWEAGPGPACPQTHLMIKHSESATKLISRSHFMVLLGPVSREGWKAEKCPAASKSCSLYTVQGLGDRSYQPPNITHSRNPKQNSS